METKDATACVKTKIRGIHFFVLIKYAQEFVNEGKVFVENYNKITWPLWEFYRKIIRDYPGTKLTKFGMLFQTDDESIIGLDGNTYELSEKVTNRKVGNKSWFTKSEQLADDEIDYSAGKKIKDTQIKDMLQSLFPEMSGSYIFDMRDYITNRILSRKRQTTKAKTFNEVLLEMDRPPLLRNPTIHSKRKRFQIIPNKETLNTGVITYRNQKDEEISTPYVSTTPLSDVVDASELFNRNIGANFKISSKKRHKYYRLTVQCKKQQTFEYEPIGWIGIDINVAAAFWLTFYNLLTGKGFSWPRGTYAQSLIDARAEITKLIDDGSKGQCTSKTRSGLRKKRFAIHKKQRKLVRKIFIPFLKSLKIAKLGLAIDMVSWGAGSGNNGMQSSICEILPDLCREIGVPYQEVKPAFSSRDCSECGHRHTENQKKKMKETFLCKKCGWTLPMHQDAARTIAMRAKNNNDLTTVPSLAPVEDYQEIVKEVTEEINSAPSDSDGTIKRDDQGEITSPVANQQ